MENLSDWVTREGMIGRSNVAEFIQDIVDILEEKEPHQLCPTVGTWYKKRIIEEIIKRAGKGLIENSPHQNSERRDSNA